MLDNPEEELIRQFVKHFLNCKAVPKSAIPDQNSDWRASEYESGRCTGSHLDLSQHTLVFCEFRSSELGILQSATYNLMYVRSISLLRYRQENRDNMPTILIVEDEIHIRQFVAVNLRARGYEVIALDNAEGGLQQLQTKAPELLVLDIKLPGMSGWNMLECIARDPMLPKVPVIIMTAFSSLNPPDDFPYESIVERLAKPLSVDQLLQAIRKVFVSP